MDKLMEQSSTLYPIVLISETQRNDYARIIVTLVRIIVTLRNDYARIVIPLRHAQFSAVPAESAGTLKIIWAILCTFVRSMKEVAFPGFSLFLLKDRSKADQLIH